MSTRKELTRRNAGSDSPSATKPISFANTLLSTPPSLLSFSPPTAMLKAPFQQDDEPFEILHVQTPARDIVLCALRQTRRNSLSDMVAIFRTPKSLEEMFEHWAICASAYADHVVGNRMITGAWAMEDGVLSVSTFLQMTDIARQWHSEYVSVAQFQHDFRAHRSMVRLPTPSPTYSGPSAPSPVNPAPSMSLSPTEIPLISMLQQPSSSSAPCPDCESFSSRHSPSRCCRRLRRQHAPATASLDTPFPPKISNTAARLSPRAGIMASVTAALKSVNSEKIIVIVPPSYPRKRYRKRVVRATLPRADSPPLPRPQEISPNDEDLYIQFEDCDMV